MSVLALSDASRVSLKSHKVIEDVA